ncbi:MAG: thioredoxin domain-containing protein [Chitinophagaceae bacterium]
MSMFQFDPNRDHYYGALDAPVELIEYGDFQCRHCADVYVQIKLVQEMLGSQVKFVFRQYPLPALHPMALDAAVAAEAAAQQNKFWYMHDMIYENQKFLSPASLLQFAEAIEIDTELMQSHAKHKKMVQKVISDFESGVKNGVDGTPTFFINGQRYNGFHDFENLYQTCREVLSMSTNGVDTKLKFRA